MARKKKEETEVVADLYMATGKYREAGVSHNYGDTTNLDGVSEDRKVYLLGRGFFVPINGYDSIPGEFGERVRKALG